MRKYYLFNDLPLKAPFMGTQSPVMQCRSEELARQTQDSVPIKTVKIEAHNNMYFILYRAVCEPCLQFL